MTTFAIGAGIVSLGASLALGAVATPATWLVITRVALAAIGLAAVVWGAWRASGGAAQMPPSAPIAPPQPSLPVALPVATAPPAARPAVPPPVDVSQPPAALVIRVIPPTPPLDAVANPPAAAAASPSAAAPAQQSPAAAASAQPNPLSEPPIVLRGLTPDEREAIHRVLTILATQQWTGKWQAACTLEAWELKFKLQPKLQNLHPLETIAHYFQDPTFLPLIKQFWGHDSLAKTEFEGELETQMKKHDQPLAPYIAMFLNVVKRPGDILLADHIQNGRWNELLDALIPSPVAPAGDGKSDQ